MTKTILAISVAAIFAIGMLSMPLGIADAMGNFLDMKKVTVKTDSSEVEKAIFLTKGQIPTDGTGGAFGYGYITDASLSAIAVTTTHDGFYDSETQDENNPGPIWHNHYVSLIQDDTDIACSGLQVENISFQEPGDVDVWNKVASMEDIPYYFAANHSLTNDLVVYNADPNIGAAVSFTIDPVDADGVTITTIEDLAAVCINDVAFIDENDLKVKEVIRIF
ncbi:MAG: hypothetical protein OEM77_06040 [Nitrosopumilus sp.]|nr:hypothetical protein [Nitrosopumilus sp.]MDH3735459.1 hypothetical protein [Nitrosopumilus sp.]MDH3822980.1 hypothetical protein [Nitrosopumilus sp.]MDH3832699.1 hypothetical protein [Nitrosopumilus sp.]